MESTTTKFDLFYSAMEGNKKSIEQVIKNYTPMVHKWAVNYRRMYQPYVYEDIVQEGILGIIKALETYDVARRTDNGEPIHPTTWIYWKTRAAVQAAARKHFRSNNESPISEFVEDLAADANHHNGGNCAEVLNEVIDDVCGGKKSKKAKILRDRFGLNGDKPMTYHEISKKYGISRQATFSHIKSFFKVIKENYSDLKEEIR